MKAYVVLKDREATTEQQDIIQQALMDECRRCLIPYACPVEYVFRKELPRTKIGKIDYRALEKEALEEYRARAKKRAAKAEKGGTHE